MKKESTISQILKNFIKFYPKQFAFLFLLLIIEGFVSALSLLAVMPLADFIIDPTMMHFSKITKKLVDILLTFNINPSFWVFGFIFVGLNLLKGVMAVIVKYGIISIKQSVVHGLFDDALMNFFSARWEFFSGSDQGLIINSLTKELSTIGDTMGHLATLFAQIIQLCIYLIVPLSLNPRMTLIALSLSITFGLPFILMYKYSRKIAVNNVATANIMTGVLNETIQAAKIILGFGNQEVSRKRYLNAFKNHNYYSLRILVLSTAMPQLFAPLGMLAAIFAMGISLNYGALVSELATVMWSLLAAMPIMSALIQGNVSIRYFLPSYEQFIELKNRAIENAEIRGIKKFEELQNEIKLENCCFKYVGREYTINNCNIIVEKGKMTALVGESGSGKSTIADLILGLQIPFKGNILIDNIPLSEYNQNSFRNRVGYVPQDPILFHTTILENLIWSNASATEFDCWEALRLANAFKFVKELPEGINTIVGDRGIRLSGGQRQRIALARALVRKPELLILDEATSALDTESETLIQDSINAIASHTTILIIAHRLSTISKSDFVYVLEKGSVIESGNYNMLIVKENGKLKNMLKLENSKMQTN